MSSSPKYCQVRLMAQMERELRRAREQQEVEERRRRAAEEARCRKRRLEEGQVGAQREVRRLITDVKSFASTNAGRFVAEKVEALGARLGMVGDSVRSAVAEAEISAAAQRIAALEMEISMLKAEGEAAHLVAAVAQEEAVVLDLRRKQQALNRARSEKFDGEGYADVAERLLRAERLLAEKNVSEAQAESTRGREALEAHRSRVEDRFLAWMEERDRSRLALSEASDRLAAVKADPVVARWSLAAVATIAGRLSAVTADIEAEKFSVARCGIGLFLQEMEDAVVAAQKLQLKEDRRRYIVQGILGAMQEQGFVIQQGYPSLDKPADPTSDLIIQAERLGGGAIAVSVPHEGEILYDVAGFEMKDAVAGDGAAIRVCDEAEETITKLHTVMADTFGIEAGELLWEDKDPLRKVRKRKDVGREFGQTRRAPR